MFETIINIKGASPIEVDSTCSKIAEKDKTFIYTIFSKGGKRYLVVESQTRDQAYKRGIWLVNRIDCLKKYNCGFEVLKKVK